GYLITCIYIKKSNTIFRPFFSLQSVYSTIKDSRPLPAPNLSSNKVVSLISINRLQSTFLSHLEQSIIALLQSLDLRRFTTSEVPDPDIYPANGTLIASHLVNTSSKSGAVNAPISFLAEAVLSHDTKVPSTNPTAGTPFCLFLNIRVD